MTRPANIEVQEFTQQMIRASWHGQLLLCTAVVIVVVLLLLLHLVHVVVVLVVGAQRHDGAQAEAVGEEDLGGGVNPDPGLRRYYLAAPQQRTWDALPRSAWRSLA